MRKFLGIAALVLIGLYAVLRTIAPYDAEAAAARHAERAANPERQVRPRETNPLRGLSFEEFSMRSQFVERQLGFVSGASPLVVTLHGRRTDNDSGWTEIYCGTADVDDPAYGSTLKYFWIEIDRSGVETEVSDWGLMLSNPKYEGPDCRWSW